MRTGRVVRSLFAGMIAFWLFSQGCSPSLPVAEREKVDTAVAEAEQERASSGSPAGDPKTEGPFVVALYPLPPTGRDAVKATLRDAMTHEEKHADSWTWFINGERTGGTGPVLPAGELKRGDEVRAEASAFSGGKGITVSSPGVMVANSLPAVSDVAFDSLSPRKGDVLKVSCRVSDPDGDPVRLTYKWVVSERVVQEGEKGDYRLASEKKGDQIHCEVYPHDGHSPGTWSSTPIVEILNSPPRFLAAPPATAGPDGTFSYRISVEDVDGDPVSIALIKGPDGMILERDTIRWRPEAGYGGDAAVVLRATDGAGGEARQEFTLSASAR